MASDWDLVGGEPARGEPQGVAFLAKAVQSTSDAAADASSELARIGGSLATCTFEGEAAESFAVAFDPLSPDLSVMARSYDQVAQALRTYADELEQIQTAATHALNRARLAKAARDRADVRLDEARARIHDLRRQVLAVKADIRIKRVQSSAASAIDPGGAADEAAAVQRAESTLRSVERALWDTEAVERAAAGERASADGDLTRERVVVDALRQNRSAAERLAESAIRGALAESLKNRSNFEKASGWVGRQAHGIVENTTQMLVAAATGDWRRFFLEARRFLNGLLMVLAVVAFVAACVLTAGAAAFVVLAVMAAVLSAAKLFCTVKVQGTVDPATGELIGRGELVWDAAMVVVSLFGLRGAVNQNKLLFKNGHTAAERLSIRSAINRATTRDGRVYKTFPQVPISAPGQTDMRTRIDYGLKAVERVAQRGRPYVAHNLEHKAQRFYEETLKYKVDAFFEGYAQPVVGPCYVNRRPS